MSLSGSGRLIDWSIRNRPGLQELQRLQPLRDQGGTGRQGARRARAQRPYEGTPTGSPSTRKFFDGFGFGANRNTLTGVPHFKATTFTGQFPVAEVDFHDERFPGAVRLVAWSPFIPTNERDSSFPAAMFEIEVTNTTSVAIDYTMGGTLGNHGCQNGVHSFKR
jgi:hypothetical protein